MSAYTQYPDFLRPIRDNNRDETILVEFHRVLKNTNMSILRNMLIRASEDPEILTLFPKLVRFANMKVDERYDATVLYNMPGEFVYSLADEKLSMELCVEYASVFMNPISYEYLHQTRLELVLFNLIQQPFVKNLYILADKFTTEMKEYISRVFHGEGIDAKIHCIEGDFLDCMTSIPEITTVFMSNVSDLMRVDEYQPDAINGKFVIIMDGYGNLQTIDGDKPSVTYQYLDTFNTWNEQKRATVAYMYPFCIPKEVQNP